MVFLGNAITDAWKRSLLENTYQDMKGTYEASKNPGYWEINPIVNALPQREGVFQAYGQLAANGVNALTDKLPENQQKLALILANLAEIATARSRKATVKLPLFSHSW